MNTLIKHFTSTSITTAGTKHTPKGHHKKYNPRVIHDTRKNINKERNYTVLKALYLYLNSYKILQDLTTKSKNNTPPTHESPLIGTGKLFLIRKQHDKNIIQTHALK